MQKDTQYPHLRNQTEENDNIFGLKYKILLTKMLIGFTLSLIYPSITHLLPLSYVTKQQAWFFPCAQERVNLGVLTGIFVLNLFG